MKQKVMKPFVLGAISAYGIVALFLVASARLGVLPVQADVAPGRLEATLLGSALHASVARHAPSGGNPMPASEENLMAGAKLYRQMCSRCHGVSKDSVSSYGQSFYPPAPQLSLHRTPYTDSELFWIVKHGIRNTAMPAWGSLLSDNEIWQTATYVGTLGALPDSIIPERFVGRSKGWKP
jgi:mono/diheme cytochrome c family protein